MKDQPVIPEARDGSEAIFGTTTSARLERWGMLSAQVFLAAWALFYLVQAAKLSLWFDGFPDNGPFQIFDPLRRIAAGQVGGRDFVFFHGIGVPYLNYPLFALFGGKTLIASEFSRQLTSFVLFVLSLGAFAWITCRRKPWVWMGAAVSVLVIEVFFPMAAAPGHSLISLRSTMPIFAFVALQLPVRHWLKAALTGVFVGAGFVCGTEHGISLALALAFVCVVNVMQDFHQVRTLGQRGRASLMFTMIALVAAAMTGALLLLLLCGVAGSLKVIHYNLVELPADQFWFFGSPPLPYFGAWSELVSDHHVILCFLPTCFALIVLVCFLVKSWNCPLRLGRDWQALAILMVFYGVVTGVPLLGILSRHYAFPLVRTMVLTGLLILANTGGPRLSLRWTLARWQGWPAVAGFAFVAVCTIASAALCYNSTVLAVGLVRHIRSGSNSYSRFLDSHWDSFMTDATQLIDANRKRPTVSLWSVYSTLLEWHYGIFHPAEDYIIHAVGPERWRHYVATFEKTQPEFVQTRTQSFDFQEWQQDERWEFFEDVLNNYTPLKTVSHAMIWQRTDQVWRAPAGGFQTVKFNEQTHSAVLPTVEGPEDRIGVVRVYYRVSNRWAWLPLLGKTPRYLATIEGSPRNLTISFPQYDSEFQFPVQLQPGKPVTLRFRTDTLLPGAVLEPSAVQVKILDWEPSQRAIYARASESGQ
ncbi:MAG: hypothetical protein M3N41_08155 [Acidobacteriota bacterium]|nr:hypothetical protein [Acidobacteriota bacterium]